MPVVTTRPKVDRKARLKIPPEKMPEQDPKVRVHNWDEVLLGLDPETAIIEATRCIQCPGAPCIPACPVHNDIPAAFWLLEQGDFIGAANTFRETSTMPEICGRICPQERLCEGACVVGKNNLPVAIGKLEAFVSDHQRKTEGFPKPPPAAPTGKKVAVVGAGPAGLTVAEILGGAGHGVVVFDPWPEPGGILLYGIPNFKMAKDLVQEKVEFIKGLGVQFISNVWIGRDKTVEDLSREGYDAVYLGNGAILGASPQVPGEDLREVYSATDFLVRGNLSPEQLPPEQRETLRIGHKVAVIGGGDTSMDCVRTAVRLGAEEVTCVYRRTEAEMPGREAERNHAKEEGVQFYFLAAPVRFLGDEAGAVQAVECIRMELGEPDDSGRRRPVPVPGSEFTIEADTVVVAVGYQADPLIPDTTPKLEAHRGGLIIVDPQTGRTSREGVFAGGDNVRGADLVVTAVADAQRAAGAMLEYLRALSVNDR